MLRFYRKLVALQALRSKSTRRWVLQSELIRKRSRSGGGVRRRKQFHQAELSCCYRQAHDDPTLENVGIVVEDPTAATTFFVELGLKMLGEVPVEGGSCLRSRLADGSGR